MRKVLILLVTLGVFFFNIAHAASVKEQYELQEHCKKSVDAWFQEKWGGKNFHENKVKRHHPPGSDILLRYVTYQNHYNRKLNKCFVLEQVTTNLKNISHYDTYTLFDINENKIYGEFNNAGARFPGDGIGFVINMGSSNRISCSNKAVWDELVKPYMNE
jgi:hypothetical protein